MRKAPIDPLSADIPGLPPATTPPPQGVSAVQASALAPGPALGPDVPQTTADVAQSGNLPVAEANALLIDLQSQMVTVKDELREAQRELAAAQAERDHAKAELESIKADKKQGEASEFDPSRPHIVLETFRSSGNYGTLAYEANARVTDPIILRRLHHLGAKLAAVPN